MVISKVRHPNETPGQYMTGCSMVISNVRHPKELPGSTELGSPMSPERFTNLEGTSLVIRA